MNYQNLKDNNLILFEVICGSQAYGTATPQSDVDRKFIYVLPKDYVYGIKYIPQIDENKDFVGWEIKRFLELLSVNNPSVIEFIGNYPKDCILYKNPIFDEIIKHRDKFITKQCRNSFAGYARQQINKAEGMNKMQNWEAKKVTKKTPLDFCYVIEGYKSRSLKGVLKTNGWKQEQCGLSAINHARDTYALFYDSKNKLNYHGVQIEKSQKIRLSSIPKRQKCQFIIHYNEDGYSSHCKVYKRYQDWLKNRNVTRWTDVKNHGQQIDGKNMLHCRRLLDMAKEIAEGKGINVRRENADYLLKIKKGEIPLRQLLNYANQEIKEIDSLFINSNLPEKIDENFIHDLLVKIRKEFYGEYSFTC